MKNKFKKNKTNNHKIRMAQTWKKHVIIVVYVLVTKKVSEH